MDRTWLEGELAAGRSIESLARELGKAPSTVAYWVRKHGLVSSHAARHAARGGLPRDSLAGVVDPGLSVRAIAARLDVSYSTARHWLQRHGLKTVRGARRAANASVRARGEDVMLALCARHGLTTFIRRGDGGGIRCLRCRSEAVTARRRRIKQALVAAAGGRCMLCGYDRSPVALQFHHLEPAAKAFELAHGGVTRSLATALAEAEKCVLLCATCHAEVEAGAATLPAVRPQSAGSSGPG